MTKLQSTFIKSFICTSSATCGIILIKFYKIDNSSSTSSQQPPSQRPLHPCPASIRPGHHPHLWLASLGPCCPGCPCPGRGQQEHVGPCHGRREARSSCTQSYRHFILANFSILLPFKSIDERHASVVEGVPLRHLGPVGGPHLLP